MENPLRMKNSIVLVPFPFDDFSSTKLRPALCLTSEIGPFDHIIVAFISSNVRNKREKFDILVKKENSLSKGTGLRVDSVIKLHRGVTIPKWLIKRKLGETNPKLSKLVESGLKNLFELKN